MPRTPINHSVRLALRLALAAILFPALAGLGAWTPAAAADHREAPLVSVAPRGDFTDVYSFVFPGASNVSPDGSVSLVGVPFDPATWRDTDILLELGSDIPDPLVTTTLPFQLAQIRLRSTEPITVFYPDGTTEQWDVELGQSPTTPSSGTLSLFPTSPNGGFFAIELSFYRHLTVTRTADGAVRTHDATSPTQMEGSGAYSTACPSDRLAIPDVTTPFCLGHNPQTGEVFPVTIIDISDPTTLVVGLEPTPAPAPTNNAPVFSPVCNMTMTEGTTLGRTIGASDPDGNSLTFGSAGLPDFCTLTQIGSNIAALQCASAIGDAGVYPITVTVTDDGSPQLSASRTFTLTVVAANRPPTIEPIGDQEAIEGEIFMRTIRASDPDGDRLSFTLVGDYAFCALFDNGDGTAVLRCDLTNTASRFLIAISVHDDGDPPLSASHNFFLTVKPRVTASANPSTVTQGETTTLSGTCSDGFEPLGRCSSLDWDFDADGDYDDASGPTVPLDTSDLDPDEYNIAARGCVRLPDDTSLCNIASTTITVVQANQPPVLDPIADQMAVEGSGFRLRLVASDLEGDDLSFGSLRLPAFCRIDSVSPGVAEIVCDSIPLGAAGQYDIGIYVQTLVADDSSPGGYTVTGSDDDAFILTIKPMVTANASPSTVAQGETATLTGTCSNGFEPEGRCSSFAWDFDGDGDYDDASGLSAIYDTAGKPPGDYVISVQGCVPLPDDTSLCNTASTTVTVVQANRPPVLDADPLVDLKISEFPSGDAFGGFLTSSDPDGDNRSFSATGMPSFGTLTDNGDGTANINFAPRPGNAGTYTYTITVTDDGSPPLSASRTFTLTVKPYVAVRAEPSTVVQGQTVTLTGICSNGLEPVGSCSRLSWDLDGDGFYESTGPAVTLDTSGLAPDTYMIVAQGCVNQDVGDPLCNTASTEVEVREPTYNDLRALTRAYVDNPLIAGTLVAVLRVAEGLDRLGLHRAAALVLDSYIRLVRAATPRWVTPAEAQELIAVAEALKN